jgi:signal transduction histidine kinase
MLSFMLQNIQVPVVVTGSQMPLNMPLSDALMNLQCAVWMAASGVPGVFVAFDRKIMLGCRTSKVRTVSFNAFESINCPYVGEVNAFGLQLYTDRDRLREILNQYVNNAVKFTASGGITLGCTQQNATLRIWVRDTGKGIPEALCNSQLFERFFKIDEFVPGTGLGLSICRSLAVSLGGTVGVSSTPGKGSTFWVDLELS